MDMTLFDTADARESFIADLIGPEGRVLWRADLPWHQGQDPKDRHVVGFVPGADGIDIFMASARHTFGAVQGGITLRAPLADVCRSGAPGGSVEEKDLWFKGVFDGAILTAEPQLGSSRSIARHLTHASAVYLLRITPDFDDQQERLAIAFSRNEPNWMWPKAKYVWHMPFEDILRWEREQTEELAATP